MYNLVNSRNCKAKLAILFSIEFVFLFHTHIHLHTQTETHTHTQTHQHTRIFVEALVLFLRLSPLLLGCRLSLSVGGTYSPPKAAYTQPHIINEETKKLGSTWGTRLLSTRGVSLHQFIVFFFFWLQFCIVCIYPITNNFVKCKNATETRPLLTTSLTECYRLSRLLFA